MQSAEASTVVLLQLGEGNLLTFMLPFPICILHFALDVLKNLTETLKPLFIKTPRAWEAFIGTALRADRGEH
jgi:hypothetical protein